MKIRHARPVRMIRTNSLIWNNIRRTKKTKQKQKKKNDLSLYLYYCLARISQIRAVST